MFGNEVLKCGVNVTNTGTSACFFREAEAVDWEVIRGTIYCNKRVNAKTRDFSGSLASTSPTEDCL